MPDLTLRLTIPHRKSKDKEFEKLLLEKWRLLIERHKKRWIEKMEIITDNGVMVFWESVPLSEIAWDLDKYLKKVICDRIEPLLDEYSKEIWIPYNRFHTRNLKSKWWSCSWANSISINLKLVHLHPRFLRYVVIHESCHLKEKNHAKGFWDLVWKYCVDYKEIRKELKKISF